MSDEVDRPAGKRRGKAKTAQAAERAVATSARPAGAFCPVAGIGASAGGLEAFSRLLRAMPPHPGLALILVQHLDPKQESMLADILGRGTKLPVQEAADGMRVEPDHVYVMPQNVTIRLSGGSLLLEKRPEPPAHVLPIDTLLRSLAEECTALSIGVVLSGTGTDGTLGLRAIREAGGLTFVQDPSTAEYDGMPTSAMEAGVVDAVLSPEGIAEELARLGRNIELTEPNPAEEPAQDVDEASLSEILKLVHDATGLDLTSYRRTTLLRRISRRMLLEDVATLKDYVRVLRERSSRVDALYRDVLVNMTEFFRDPDALEALKRRVFPELLGRAASGGSIRIWIPGCSKGQEAYSILITLVEFLDGVPSSPDIQMFATDVNERDVEFARAGVYPQGIAGEVSPERLARFFVQVPGGYQIDRSIREACVFAVHDVTKDPPFSKLDLVSLRNVLIYMERSLQERVLQILHYALEPGGFLLLGSAETAGSDSARFSVVDKKYRIYTRKPGQARLLASRGPSAGMLGFTSRDRLTGDTPAFDALAEAEKIVQGRYQPAGILVGADLDILQFRGHVAPYLDPAEGPPGPKLSRTMAPGLFSTVEAAIREATRTNAPAKRRTLTPGSDDGSRQTDIEAVPITAPTGESYFLVLFKERPSGGALPKRRTRRGTEHAAAGTGASDLRRELDETRERLEAVVAEREAANAELREASERFQTGNEELRTINEEFQTAQEELQSTNEELTTLNDELRNRNVELGRLADDLNNVIEGVEIPILILDTELRLRRFTPRADEIVNIVPADVGRPITDFSMKVGIPGFEDAIRTVLREEALSQTEVRSAEGRWYSMRIRPYETGEGSIDGVVVAFLDVDELKKSMQIAEAARAHAEAVVETVREPLLTLDRDLQVVEANGAFYNAFAVTPDATLGASLYELGDGQWDFPELRTLLEQVIPGDKEFAGLEVEHDFPSVGPRVMALSARRVREEGLAPAILLAIDDVTDMRRRERMSTALNAIGQTIGSTLEFDLILDRVLEQSAQALGADSGAVILKEDGAWVMKNVFGLSAALEGRVLEDEQVPISRLAAAQGKPVFFDDITSYGQFASSVGIEL